MSCFPVNASRRGTAVVHLSDKPPPPNWAIPRHANELLVQGHDPGDDKQRTVAADAVACHYFPEVSEMSQSRSLSFSKCG